MKKPSRSRANDLSPTHAGKTERWSRFPFKRRGEWVQLEFMAKAAEHGFTVLGLGETLSPTISPSITATA